MEYVMIQIWVRYVQNKSNIEIVEIYVLKDFKSKYNSRGFRGCVNLLIIIVYVLILQYLVYFIYNIKRN